RNGLDPYLVAAVVKVESNFEPQARSPRGAAGLMQLMPETGAWAARQLGETEFDPSALFDPELNVRLGTRYLAALWREFGGDTVLVLAAYNAGSGRVKEWLARAEWTGEGRTVDQIPFPETRHFVRKVLWYHEVYRYLYGRG
ncbi:MAG: lytic transglycosylase domain-containing protein, partial [Firmicutes bacterium]|nr:lytic transglycosylase domain-containing protein [Bacillota bacterium]